MTVSFEIVEDGREAGSELAFICLLLSNCIDLHRDWKLFINK